MFAGKTVKIELRDFQLFYGDFPVLKQVSAVFAANTITAIIGPSGCGKSTLLRSINRMNDIIEGVRVAGEIRLDGKNVYDPEVDLIWLRAKIGMVFQRPVAFPLSIFDNVAAAPRVRGITDRTELARTVEESLKAVGLWRDERSPKPISLIPVFGRPAKLCIARAIATAPDVVRSITMLRPDPISTHHQTRCSR